MKTGVVSEEVLGQMVASCLDDGQDDDMVDEDDPELLVYAGNLRIPYSL